MAEDTAAPTPETPEENAAQPEKRKRLLRILLIAVIVIAAVWGVWYFLTQAGRVSTDNAYVGADSATITALIAAPVKEVRVSGTQVVKKGDILVILDDADAKIRGAHGREHGEAEHGGRENGGQKLFHGVHLWA